MTYREHRRQPLEQVIEQMKAGDAHACMAHDFVAISPDDRWIVTGKLRRWEPFGLTDMTISPRRESQDDIVTSTVLQRLPIGRWLAALRSGVAAELLYLADVAEVERRANDDDLAMIRKAADYVDRSAATPTRRTGSTSVYRDLAEAYLRIQEQEGTRGINRRTAEVLAEEHGLEPIPEGTFRDWLRKATELGYLSPGQRGRAGRSPGPALHDPQQGRRG